GQGPAAGRRRMPSLLADDASLGERIYCLGSWRLTLGVWGTLAIVVPIVQCQEQPSRPSPTSSASGSVAGNGRVSVEQLAERLRIMEETNKKLAAELERSSREHAEQMKLLLGKYDELTRRLGNGAEPTAPGTVSKDNGPSSASKDIDQA